MPVCAFQIQDPFSFFGENPSAIYHLSQYVDKQKPAISTSFFFPVGHVSRDTVFCILHSLRSMPLHQRSGRQERTMINIQRRMLRADTNKYISVVLATHERIFKQHITGERSSTTRTLCTARQLTGRHKHMSPCFLCTQASNAIISTLYTQTKQHSALCRRLSPFPGGWVLPSRPDALPGAPGCRRRLPVQALYRSGWFLLGVLLESVPHRHVDRAGRGQATVLRYLEPLADQRESSRRHFLGCGNDA